MCMEKDAGKKKFAFSIDRMQKFLAASALLIIVIFFSIFGNNFFSLTTLNNVLEASYVFGFLAIGVTFIIITGGIDLSCGTVMIASGLIAGFAYNNWKWPIWLALGVSLVVGVGFGLLSGLLVTKGKIVPFVATLGMQMIASGLGGSFVKVQTQRFPDIMSADGIFKRVLYKAPGGFPMGIVWLMLFFVIAYIILNKTRIGRYTYAMGSNEEAARLSGIQVDKWKMIVYAINGFFTGLAGIYFAAAYTALTPMAGAGNETFAIAAVVIGGTSLAGGVGTLTGTLIGVFIMSVLKTGLLNMGLNQPDQVWIMGVVLIGAVMLDVYLNARAKRVRKTS